MFARTKLLLAVLLLTTACDDNKPTPPAPPAQKVDADTGVEQDEVADEVAPVAKAVKALPDGHPDDVVVDLTQKAPERFWNRVTLPHGAVIRPNPPQTTKETALLSDEQAREIIQDAANYGLARWCAISTSEDRRTTIDAMRGKQLGPHEVAYGQTLFDTSSMVMYGYARRELGLCTPERSQEVAARIQKSVERHRALAEAYRLKPANEQGGEAPQ